MQRYSKWLLVCLVALVFGCGKDAGNGGQAATKKPELLLFVGAGIRLPVDELAQVFGEEHDVKMMLDYAGSEVLINKIKLGASGDVYIPGDKHYVNQAADEDMILSQASVCYFVPTILVQKGNPKEIAALTDLLKPGVRLGLGDARACAIGRKSKGVFEKNGIAWSDVEKNLAYQSLTVNELGMQIQAGSLDAVIVWDAVAVTYAQYGDQVSIPRDQNIISTVDAGILSFSEQPELARQFIDLARSNRGREIFNRHGYRVDPPK
jgi:molybdate transport system substrate-binding protein